MSYLDNFERNLMKHTLAIMQEYKGQYDATILINCLLGLLVVPKEKFLNAIPTVPLEQLADWGITPTSIEHAGKPTKTNPHPDTLRGLVHSLRNAIAHCNISPVPRTTEVHSFIFTAKNGLRAVIKLDEMRIFIERLATHLDAN